MEILFREREMDSMKLSVVLFDAGYRERFHTVDSLRTQTLPRERYEILWVEYFDRIRPELSEKKGVKFLTLRGKEPWSIGKCVNAGILAASGDLLVVMDGDVLVKETFLESIWRYHLENEKLFMHVHRLNQREASDEAPDYETISGGDLKADPRNYIGCLSVRKKWLLIVNGYEEMEPLSRGPAVALDLYVRLSNLGLHHLWHPEEFLIHPWHRESGGVGDGKRLKEAGEIIKYREEHGIIRANRGIERYRAA